MVSARIIAVAFVTVLLSDDLARAVPGQLAGTTVLSAPDGPQAIAVQSDDRIVVVGPSQSGFYFADFAVTRLDADGNLDPSFAGTGSVTIPLGPFVDDARAVAIQSDGRIVVAGFARDFQDNLVNDGDIGVVRLEPDGDLDLTFNGTGKVVTSFGSFGTLAYAVGLQSDGRIVVAGITFPSTDAFDGAVVLARYESDGTLDATFDGDGFAVTPLVAHVSAPPALVIQSDGRIVVSGEGSGAPSGFELARYLPDGAIDTSFGGDGVVSTTGDLTGAALALQPDQRILVAGTVVLGSGGERDSNVRVERYLADGSLDPSFGEGGSVVVPSGNARHPNDGRFGRDSAQEIALDGEGRIVVAGGSRSSRLNGDNAWGFLVARLLSNGSLDGTFGPRHASRLAVRGKVASHLSSDGFLQHAEGVGILSDGGIIVAGSSRGDPSGNVVARFHGGCETVSCPIGEPLDDADGDCECDAQDPCTNAGAQDFAPKPLLVVNRIHTDVIPGNDRVNPLQATFALPAGTIFADLDPDADGARVVIETRNGIRAADIAVPAGTFIGGQTAGWRRSSSGKAWTFRDNTGSPANGIVKLIVSDKHKPSTPNRVAVKVLAHDGHYPVAPEDLPLQVTVTLGDQDDAAAGLCGDSRYADDACSFNAAGNTLTCQK